MRNVAGEPRRDLQLMEEMRRHARRRGNPRAPVYSPPHAALTAGHVEHIGGAGFPIVPWTVNAPARMRALIGLGVTGIITDRPDLLVEALESAAGPPEVDVQGHRGARGLRPENTLPAMEAALDAGATTLETDCGVTADGVAVLCHDPVLDPAKCRQTDGRPYGEASAVPIATLRAAEIQARFVADGLPAGGAQRRDRALSPASVAFAEEHGLADAYVVPTLAQLFAFADFYAGVHRDDPARSLRGAHVRFNIETKLGLDRGVPTAGPEEFVDAVADPIVAHGLGARADVQSFDWRTLRVIHERHPAIRTVCLFGAPAEPAQTSA